MAVGVAAAELGIIKTGTSLATGTTTKKRWEIM